MNPTAALIEPEVLELLREKQYAELREVLHVLPAADVADILSGIEPTDAAIAFRFLPRDDAGTVFSYLDGDTQERIIRQLGDSSAVTIIESMDPDDRVRLLDELPHDVAQRIIASLSPEERKSTQAILGYPVRSVGRLMTPDYVRIRPEWTVARALDHIRRYGRDAETINVVYVVDDMGVLIDDLRLRQLIMAEPDATVESQMNRQFVTLRADQPQEDAVELLQKYDRVAMPVIDSRGILLGIITPRRRRRCCRAGSHRGHAEARRCSGPRAALRRNAHPGPGQEARPLAGPAVHERAAHQQRHRLLRR